MSLLDTMAKIPESLGATTTTGFAVLACYVALCRGLRFLRRNQKHAQYPYKNREDFAKMTGEHAFEIVKYIMELEFPIISKNALSFALFKTYGIPTISKLLCETQQLSVDQFAARRYADTSTLIVEFLGYSPTSVRANSAIARMNYLHGRYQKAGKISNEDLLYTLSLFILEVEAWIRRYEWRSLTDMEICALGTQWKNIGDAMGINFKDLAHGPNDFRDGYEFFFDVKEWAEQYEEEKMVEDDYNHKLAEETAALLLADAPAFLNGPGKQVIYSLMEKRLRVAMKYPDPKPSYAFLTISALKLRRFVLSWLMPPRPHFLRHREITDPDPKTGRCYRTEYANQPWYIAPTFWNRNSPLSWARWAMGKPYPNGDKKYQPEGYTVFEVGPEKMVGKGLDECAAIRDQLLNADRGQCPFAFRK